jgi:uncharacterized protein (TIGR02757 family)
LWASDGLIPLNRVGLFRLTLLVKGQWQALSFAAMGLPGDFADFLLQKAKQYNTAAFIFNDPVSVPHRFSQPCDVEIAGFFAAVFSWGNRTTIIQKSNELMKRMDDAPHDFVLHHQPADLKNLMGFKHRTFQEDDLFYFIHFLRRHYQTHASLEPAFAQWLSTTDKTVEKALVGFRNYFFSCDHLPRTRKHISSPQTRSSCKRLNMFLRWMVRKDHSGVDFGLWKHIHASQLVCPLDLHVARVARRFQLLRSGKTDWQAALELTAALRKMNPDDPVHFDFALFGLGIVEKY